MLHTTAGRLRLQDALPAGMDLPEGPLDKKGVGELFDALAKNHPDEYRESAQKLLGVARDVAYSTGGFSFGLAHMLPAREAEGLRRRVEWDVANVRGRRDLDDAGKDREVVRILQEAQKPLEDAVFRESEAEGNPLAHQVKNVGRGNKASLRGLRAGDVLYEDHNGNAIPIPALTPYSSGLKPVEYFAAAFGARKSLVDVKSGTARAGYLSKLMSQAAHRLVVTGHDHEDGIDRSHLGLPVEASDPDNVGALLARQVGPYGRNQVLTPKILAHIQAEGVKHILVRSPTVGGPPEGGVHSRDLGIREKGVLPPRGDYVGIAAAQAIGEKASQSSLSSKHSGGVAGANAAVAGLPLFERLVSPPKVFPGGATHAQHDGTVTAVLPAPQGGHYIEVDGHRHYAPADRKLTVEPGAKVEAGDVLTDGIPSPAEVVKHKGIGEGRRHYVGAFRSAFKAAGLHADRRNVELLARGAIDHVELDDEMGDHAPGDVVPYQALEAAYEPREGARRRSPREAAGHYLEAPVLHHSIGTLIRPSVIRDLEQFGIKDVLAHRDPPPFFPVMLRGMDLLKHDPDVLARHLGSGLEGSTLEAVHRGRSSDTAGTSYVPAAAERANFGRHGLTRGYDAASLHAAQRAARDGDHDGHTGDGTAKERPARRSLLDDLGL